MKKIFFIICFLIISMCSGCNMAWDGSDTASADMKIGSDFTLVPGESNLYYANDTKIVYWIGGSYMLNGLGDDYTTSYITYIYNRLKIDFNASLISTISAILYKKSRIIFYS